MRKSSHSRSAILNQLTANSRSNAFKTTATPSKQEVLSSLNNSKYGEQPQANDQPAHSVQNIINRINHIYAPPKSNNPKRDHLEQYSLATASPMREKQNTTATQSSPKHSSQVQFSQKVGLGSNLLEVKACDQSLFRGLSSVATSKPNSAQKKPEIVIRDGDDRVEKKASEIEAVPAEKI